MDTTALRLENLKVALEGAYRAGEFHARWRTALFAVTATLAGSIVLASLAGQLLPVIAAPSAAGAAVLSGWQLYGVRRLGRGMKRAANQARRPSTS